MKINVKLPDSQPSKSLLNHHDDIHNAHLSLFKCTVQQRRAVFDMIFCLMIEHCLIESRLTTEIDEVFIIENDWIFE